MKRLLSLLLVILVFVAGFSVNVSAMDTSKQPTYKMTARSVQQLESGDYIVTELFVNQTRASGTASGYRTSTYYNAAGTAVWDVTVQGYFSYVTGVSAVATSASVTVVRYNTNTVLIDKNAWCSGNTANASASVRYNASYTSASVSISCDSYGNLY